MKALLKLGDRMAPRRQNNWDWRAAANFICGGSGGGLLLWAAFASLHGIDTRPLVLLGLALIGLGLTCVWFEIGRPWRALNVFRHLTSSWMTREASIAPFVFVAGATALGSAAPLMLWATGLFGAAFVYSQARILTADKGIPAWRHPLCLPLVFVTGLTEGAGLVAMATLVYAEIVQVAFLLAVLLVLRRAVWRRYLPALAADGAPSGALAALRAIDNGFARGGNALPAIVALAAGYAGMPLLAALAGAAAVAAGWWMKFTLVRRAAYTQGFALLHLPVRGRGTAGPATKPGWEGAGSI